jgi:hypothetical protein
MTIYGHSLTIFWHVRGGGEGTVKKVRDNKGRRLISMSKVGFKNFPIVWGEFKFKRDYVNKTRMVIVREKFISYDFFP